MQVIQYEEWLEQNKQREALHAAYLASVAGVDGIVDMDNLSAFPPVGVVGLLYIAKDTGKLYTWNVAEESYVRADAGSDYTLPKATDASLGGIIVGTGLEVAEDGNLSISKIPTIRLSPSTELTEVPSIEEDTAVIWYDSTVDSEKLNLTVKFTGFEAKTIELTTGALIPEA